MPPMRAIHQTFAAMFGVIKLKSFNYKTVKKVDDRFRNFNTVHECDRQTDRQNATAYTSTRTASHAKKAVHRAS